MPILSTKGGASASGFGGIGGSSGGGGGTLYNFTSHQFTNAGSWGTSGPTYADTQSAYTGAPFLGDTDLFNVLYTGLQLWTVPSDGEYRFDMRGAIGGAVSWGQGGEAYQMTNGRINLLAGEKLLMLIGQKGGESNNSQGNSSAGGGGGTFLCKYVADNNVTPIAVAAGGNGYMWSSWTANAPDARSSSVWSAGPWWDDSSYDPGRGGAGGGFNQDYRDGNERSSNNYINYSTFNGLFTEADTYMMGTALLAEGASGTSIQNGGGYTTLTSKSGLGGAPSSHSSIRTAYNNPAGLTAFGFGGYGGGAGAKHEGGGGGGYWGGLTPTDNNYGSNYNWGAVSYVNSSLVSTGPSESKWTPSNMSTLYGGGSNAPADHHGEITITKIS